MRWVLGTGRCGLHSYTIWKGGTIDSNGPIRALAVKKYHDGKLSADDTAYVVEFFKKRAALKTPFVVDCCQFMFIDEILVADPKAEFTWILGDKDKVVEGFMEKVAEDQRIHPKGWDFKYENKRKLLSWYFDEVNRIIERKLESLKKPFEKIMTSDIPLRKVL